MRKSYIAKQRDEHRRKVVGVLPIWFPKELLTALGLYSVEIWGPPGPPKSVEAGRIQTYVCPVVRNAMGFLADKGGEALDALLFPHTCDSIQGLATLLPDLAGYEKPVFHFIHPKGDERASSRKYVKRELQALCTRLEEFAGAKLDNEKLADAIRLHRRIDAKLLNLLDKRPYIKLDDREFYGLLRQGEYLWPEDFLAVLEELEEKIAEEPVQEGVPLMITGIVPEPMSIFDNLAEAGAFVVADDYAVLRRRISRLQPEDVADDPFDTLVDLYFSLPPCSTRAALVDHRRNYLMNMYRKSGARGVVFHNVKFCEPEMFDLPHLKKRFAAEKIPVLYMESELEAELSGQTVTRLEAFVEMAQSGK